MEASLRVLIVDDQISMRGILKKMLHQMGYFQSIEEAGDGEDAWEKLTTLACDLVISDVNMPRLDGLGLLKRCRGELELKDLPFLMISGDAFPEIVASAGEWGAYDYIVKPFSYNILKMRVQSIFERWHNPEESLYREVERLKKSGHCREALKRIDRLEKTIPKVKPKWWNLKGECLLEVGETQQAVASIERALKQSDNFLAAYKNYATAQQRLGNIRKAIEALERADSLSPMDLDRKFTLGKLLMQAGREEEGKAFLDKVLKQTSAEDREANRMKVAEVYLERGCFSEAEELYAKTLKENPEAIEALNRLGIALRHQGKFEEAENYYRLALKTNPNNHTLYYNLGVLYLNLKDKAKAAGCFKKALLLEPDFKEAEKMLGIIQKNSGAAISAT